MSFSACARTGIAGHELLFGGLVDPSGAKIEQTWLKDGGYYQGDCTNAGKLIDLTREDKEHRRFNLLAQHVLSTKMHPTTHCMYGGKAVRKVRVGGVEWCEKGGRITKRQVKDE